MIAIDTNVLVHAHRRDSPFHEPAVRCLTALGEGTRAWAIPFPCVHEFLSVVTNRRLFPVPSTLAQALDQVAAWQESPGLRLLHETADHLDRLSVLLLRAKVTGPQVHDARVAAICLGHAVDELLTADRDFSRFPTLATRNPLIEV
jgi:toxin-antitoxin system PIN domain toxin